MDRTQTELTLQVWSRLIRVARKISRAGSEQLQTFRLTPAQFDLLRRINERENQTQQDLVDQLNVTRGNISQLVSKLEADGLVQRIPQGSANVIALTVAGQAFVVQLNASYEQFVSSHFSRLSLEELQQLLKLVEKLEQGEV